MKKVISLIVTLTLALTIFAGCSTYTNKSFTYNIDNGDTVRVELDTTGGAYNITSDLPFSITVSGEVQTQGKFIQGAAYAQFVSAAQTDEKATVLDSGTTKEGNEYVFWSYDGSEFNYAVKVADSSTALLLGNGISEESARACFERLTITAE